MNELETKLNQALEHYFHYTSFRPGQKETILAALNHENTLVLLPTGTGKSICYQLTGYLLEGMVVIVSPLLSLMQDQVEQLKQKGEKRVAALTSMLDYQEKNFIFQHFKEYKFLFLSPEMLQQERVMQELKQVKIALFAIDEAHCISQWGMDFRPDYLALGTIRQQLNWPLTMALTATANQRVREDIFVSLKLVPQETTQVIHSVDRPNIGLKTIECYKNKNEIVLEYVRKLEKPGIIYFSSRKMADELAELIRQETSLVAESYHSVIESQDRIRLQQQFIHNQIDIVCATNAFGMGVNKANIRFVIHYHIPSSMESYLQEIGRCGRDGEESLALLLYEKSDVYLQMRLQENDLPTEDMIAYTYRKGSVLTGSCSESQQRLLENFLALKIPLEDAKAQLRSRAFQKNSQLNYMVDYAETSGCKREMMLHYFEEQKSKVISNCCSSCGLDEEPYLQKDGKLPSLTKNELEKANNWQEKLIQLFNFPVNY
ncbi:RecQ family ATP-dependent DNA helicase [Carnobacterium gallinarum]|uniref:RecQ family ATP-dependent DNA helicase n=1 Tax=Carnobacterium gallinarum TaxID=2749 RepID=UPI0005591425|nr:ATP-dependent DNA helicase RecQ [Carnobacterium gallinarum]